MKRSILIIVVGSILAWPALCVAQNYSCGYFNKCPPYYKSGSATFWENAGRQGAHFTVNGERRTIGPWTNRISSVKIRPDSECVVCTDNYFYGKCLVLKGDWTWSNLPPAFTRTIKSINCRRLGYFTTLRLSPVFGETWNDPNFGGWRNYFKTPFTSAYLPKVLRRSISSIRLGSRVKCTVWDRPGFKGRRFEIPPGATLRNLSAQGFDNTIASIRCVKLPKPPVRATIPPTPERGQVGPGFVPGARPGLKRRCPPNEYWQVQLRRCVCVPGYKRPLRGRRCVPLCRWPQVYNPRIKRCYLPCVWPARWDPGLKKCVPPDCPPDRVYNPAVKRCVLRCPPPNIWHARLRRCVPSCPRGLVWHPQERRCVALTQPRPGVPRQCPPGQYWNTRLRRCVCRPGLVWSHRHRECVRRAAPPRPPITRRCPPGQYWNVRLRRCLCPTGHKWNHRAKRCLRVVR
jgi:hypothetical protein